MGPTPPTTEGQIRAAETIAQLAPMGATPPTTEGQIRAAETIAQLVPIGTNPPTTERQVRPLVKLDPEQRVEAWGRATERAADLGKPKPTGVIVAAVSRWSGCASVSTTAEPL